MRNFGFKKTICSVVTAVFGTTQVLLYAPVASADNFTDYANQGTQQGSDSRSWFMNNLPSLEGKKMTIKTQKGKDLSIANTDDMAGGSSSKYASETTIDSLQEMRDIAGDRTKQTESATSRKDALMTAIQKITQGDSEAKTTIENTVYGIIDNLASNKMADYSSDAMWQMTRSVLENLALHAEDLATCDSETSLVTRDEVIHVPDVYQCQQVLDRTGECDLTHEYGVAQIVSHVSGPLNIGQCIDKNKKVTPYCVRIWAGKIGFHTQGSGEITTSVKFQVDQIDAIQKAELVYMSTEDKGEAFFGPVGNLKQYYCRYSYRDCSQWDPYSLFGPINCGHGASFSKDPNPGGYSTPTGSRQAYCSDNPTGYFQNETGTTDFTDAIRFQPNGTVFDFTVRNYVPSGSGGGYGAIQIYYDPAKLTSSHDSWGPTSCMDVVMGISDGMAEGSFTCTDMPETDDEGCYIEDLTPVCEHVLQPSPFPDISPLCRKVKVSGNFTFYKGDTGCWQGYMGSDADGNPIYEEVCGGENVGGNLDTCQEYEEAGCRFLGSECTDGMTGASGNCYVADVSYDCGKDTIVPKSITETDYTCSGIRCLGTECAEITETKSTDFAKVNAVMNMLENAAQDMECTGVDEDGAITGTDNVRCQVFKGEEGKCKIAVGGWQNCCKQNSTAPSIHTYIKTMRNVSNARATQKGLENVLKSGNFNITNAMGGLVEGAVDFAGGMMWQIAGQYVSFINKDAGNIIQAAAATPDFVYKGVDSFLDSAFSGFGESGPNLYNTTKSWITDLFNPIKEFKDEIVRQIKEYLKDLLQEFMEKLGELFGKSTLGGGTGTGGAMSGGGGGATGAAGSAGATTGGGATVGGATTAGGAGGTLAGGTAEAAGATAAEGALSSAIGTALMVVGYVYMAYMIAKMVVSMVYACEEEEMQTVSSVAVKNCHYIGTYCKSKVLGVCIVKMKSYCCFQSQLGRIINEQIRLQMEEKKLEDGTVVKVPKIADWGSARSPYCEGLSVEDLNKVDWDAIDLSEWTRILEQNNLNMDQEQALTEDNMTGKGEAFR